jgi:hypothetical protein
MSFPPEVFTWIGICLFLMLSLLAYCYLSGHLSKLLPIFYQLLAFEGLTQMFALNYIFQIRTSFREIASYLHLSIAIVSALFTLLVFQKKVGCNSADSKGNDIYDV